MPWISEDWRKHFKWRGTGPLPDVERSALRRMVERIDSSGRLARFRSAPDTESAWREFRDAGVDLLNTDDLVGMNKFLWQVDRNGRRINSPAQRSLPVAARKVISISGRGLG